MAGVAGPRPGGSGVMLIYACVSAHGFGHGSRTASVLEALHPGAGRRLSALAERWGEELDAEEELLALALASLTQPVEGPALAALARPGLSALAPANQGRLLQAWLTGLRGQPLASEALAQLVARLAPARGPGQMDLGEGWQLRWQHSTLVLIPPDLHG